VEVTREVILDLIPLVLGGEASPASRALVEEYLKQHPDLADRVRVLQAEGFAPTGSSELTPDLELKSLRRTKRLLGLQRWLFGLGIALTAVSLGMRIEFREGRIAEFRFLLSEYPVELGIPLVVGLGFLIAYFVIRRRQRASAEHYLL
jgi:hypothetical protein